MVQDWPLEYADQLILGKRSSPIAICCLWSVRERISAYLDPDTYCVIGNLYSRAGISPMLRNLLANPTIRYLVLTGRSLTDSDDALVRFFRDGIDSQWRIIGSDGQIERDLPKEALSQLRKNVELTDLRGLSAKEFGQRFQSLRPTLTYYGPYAEPRVFPKGVPTSNLLPSEEIGFLVRRRTVIDAWCEAVSAVMRFGRITATNYGIQQREVLSLLSIIEEPSIAAEIPDWSPFTAADVEKYLSTFFRKDKTDDIAYNYGYRLQTHWHIDQIFSMVTELRRSEHSRRVVASLWDPQVDSLSPDPPCIDTVQAVIREGRLHLTCYIRSNDIYRAYPLNAFAMSELQARLVMQLGSVALGTLSILSYSAHVYSDCWDLTRGALEHAQRLQIRFDQDQRSSFVFSIEGGRLRADHFSPKGDLVQSFTSGKPADLAALIAPFVSRVDHALYLGREIERLASALRTGRKYTQDKA